MSRARHKVRKRERPRPRDRHGNAKGDGDGDGGADADRAPLQGERGPTETARTPNGADDLPSAQTAEAEAMEEAAAVGDTPTPTAPTPSAAVSDEDASNVTPLGPVERGSALRILEALLFAASEPLDVATLQSHLDDDADAVALLDDLRGLYAGRGVNLVNVAGRWAFRTAPDLGYLLERHQVETRRLSKAALETLSIIAYHQPVTRAQIEEVRGVQTSKGTLDVLLETGWVRPRGRRRAPGRPLTYGTTDGFLEHFGFANLGDLPGAKDLKEAGLLDAQVPEHFAIPDPEAVADLMPDELPLDADDDEHDDPMSPSLPFEEDASDGDALARDELDEGTGGAEKRANGRRRS